MVHQQDQHPLIVLMEDEVIHTDDHPFCDDPTCGCHENPALIAEVHEAIRQGLITSEEAILLIQGKTL